MRRIMPFMLAAACLALAACNTVHGAGEDARSVGRVFSKHPDGSSENRDQAVPR